MISSGPWFSGERGFQASVTILWVRDCKPLKKASLGSACDGIRWRWHSVAMALEIAVEIAGGWVLRGFVSIV